MALSADVLLDRMKLKGKLTFWRILSIVALVLLAVSMIERGSGFGHSKDYIARIDVEGVIIDNPARDDLFEQVKEDKKAKALIVRIDSPGGTVSGGQQLYDSLRDVSSVKPVVVLIRTVGASAAYMAALGGDRIFAQEGSLTGSIGVIFQSMEFTSLAEKVGVKSIEIKSAPLKASPSPFEKLTPDAEKAIQDVILDVFNTFTGMVEERRKLGPELLKKVSDGRVFTGKQALELNLIDELGGEKQAIAWLASQRSIAANLEVEEVRLKDKSPNFFEVLDDMQQKISGSVDQLRLDGLVSMWQPEGIK